VIHAVVTTGKRGVKDPAAAEALARRIRGAMDGVAGGDDFEARARRFEAEAGKALRIERLPPFDEGSKRFVREFVAAAFAVPGAGGLSPAFRTSFGWHVLLVLEELPAANVAFAQAKEKLAEERLPFERQRRLAQLLERLERDNPVFLYETPVREAE
jgi:parvulin-like peptidyl-prolyl isomerase